jgi:ATP-dependent Clp protease protease subunit
MTKYTDNTLVPVVIEKDPNGIERSYDIYSRLLKDFIVFVTGGIDMGVANTFIAQMLFLESTDPERDINIYINSQGGVTYAGKAMYDTIKHVKNDVSTINVGLAASAAALLLGAGTKGKRFALPHARTMIHQTRIMGGGVEGTATDVEIEAKEMVRSKEVYAEIIAENTGQSKKQVMDDIERDKWMDAPETKEYGLIDKIMEPKKK